MPEFAWNEHELRALLQGQHGPVGRDLARRVIRVQSVAKTNASGRPGPNVISGRLRASISWVLGVDFLGLYADVGSDVEYSLFVEAGTSRAKAYPYLRPALPAAAG